MGNEVSAKAIIVHDASGQIISVGRAPPNSRVRVEVKSETDGHSVLEVQLDSEQASLSLADLHKSHKVHVASKTLVKK